MKKIINRKRGVYMDKDLKFIREFGSIKITNICKELNIDKSNGSVL